jgi:predicted ATPase
MARTLHDITGGNPEMLALAADRLVASGVIRGRANQWRREASVDAVQDMLPRMLAAVVGAQIDRLSPDERTLLEAVATAGMEFTAASAALAADTSEPEAERLLNLMADRRLLIRRTAEVVSHRPVRAGAFRFLHPMHVELLTERAPITQQIRSARRLAAMAERAAIQEA